jgi:heptosyltransferase I
MRLLFVRLGSLGDIVHAAPAVAAVRHARPDAEIDWLVDVRQREVLDLVEGVARVVPVRSSAAGWLAARRALREVRYDAALDFQGLLKSAALAWLSNAPRRVGFDRAALRERGASFCYTETVSPPAGGHIIDKNLALLRAVGIDATAPGEFPFRVPPSRTLERVHALTGSRFAIVNPGAAWPNKRWHPDRFGGLAAAIRSRFDLPSIVIWGPGERDLADRVVAASCGAAALAPATSIADLFAIAGAAALMVSGDTGPLHIAAAMGTPIVGIYGPTDPRRNGPWLPRDVCVSRFVHCECHHLRRCRRSTWCLEDVQVAELMDAVERRLSGASA